MSNPVTPDRPSIEELLDRLEGRAMQLAEYRERALGKTGNITATSINEASQLLRAAREALLSRFLEQQKELEERALTSPEAKHVQATLEFFGHDKHGCEKCVTLFPKLAAAIQPGGTPQK